jgi:Ribbon-helix-helix protein, copG family
MHMKMRPPKRREAVKRSGVPITVYLPDSQASRLSEICKARHVTKSAIVRLAVDQLFTDLNSGQLSLGLTVAE